MKKLLITICFISTASYCFAISGMHVQIREQECPQDPKAFQEIEKKGGNEFCFKNAESEGDFRVRYISKHKDVEGAKNREEFRVRYGVKADINEEFRIGARVLAEFGDNVDEDVVLDNAYIEYVPSEEVAVVAGKFDNPLFAASDLIWDVDARFKGQAAKLKKNVRSDIDLFLNTAVILLDEGGESDANPMMFGLQPGVKYKMDKDLWLKAALGYYGFKDLKGQNLEGSAGSNSVANGGLQYSFNCINFVSKLIYDFKANNQKDYTCSFVVDYITNLDSDDVGYLLGVSVGSKEFSEPGQWKMFYNWRRLEQDAIPDVFPRIDFYSGKTNVQGHNIGLEYMIKNNLCLGLSYFYAEDLENREIEEHLVLADLVVGF